MQLMEKQMEETTLCVHCRSKFTDAALEGATSCPACGTRGVPANLSEKHTVTLTDHEWRIVFMWADNYANSIKDDEGSARECIAGIRSEVKQQCPDMPSLTLFGEIQEAASAHGLKMELHKGGEVTKIEPEKKH
jgi:hypothetical protein